MVSLLVLCALWDFIVEMWPFFLIPAITFHPLQLKWFQSFLMKFDALPMSTPAPTHLREQRTAGEKHVFDFPWGSHKSYLAATNKQKISISTRTRRLCMHFNVFIWSYQIRKEGHKHSITPDNEPAANTATANCRKMTLQPDRKWHHTNQQIRVRGQAALIKICNCCLMNLWCDIIAAYWIPFVLYAIFRFTCLCLS